jgi:hypothetical protein
MNSLIQSKNTTILPILIALMLGCFGLSPTARAVDPPPDGGYPNGTTAEGEDALFSLTDGDNNTAVGFHALFSNGGVDAGEGQGGGMHSDNNTAVGWIALQNNTGGRANTAIGANAMPNNTGGDANIAVGVYALRDNSTGTRNTAIGTESLKKITDLITSGLAMKPERILPILTFVLATRVSIATPTRFGSERMEFRQRRLSPGSMA